MVMNTERNNYNLDTFSENKSYNNYQHHHQGSSLNYNSWHVDSSTQHNDMHQARTTKVEDASATVGSAVPATSSKLCCCAGITNRNAGKVEKSSYNNGTYDSRTDDDDEDGFRPKPGTYRYHQSIVNYTGNSASTNILRNADEQANKSSESCWILPPWCFSVNWCCSSESAINTTTPENESCCSSWCKPFILMLLLILLVVIFILVSGILLYFNYIAYKPIPSLIETPCEKAYCQFGAECIVGDDGTPHCECIKTCPTMFKPVCASDGITYPNHCDMRRTSCMRGEILRVNYEGECELPDPCRDVKCQHGARCVPSVDGRSAKCECPTRCPLYGDHTASRPVCGTDGVDYRDTCELRRAACNTDTNISVKYYGKCDPCSSVSCPEPEVCQLDSNRNPVCRCGETCSLEFTPVCGSDGKTYANECALRQESCRSRKILRINYRGKCSSGLNPCLSLKCENGQECVITKFGTAQCECPLPCEPVMSPVCGSDSRTYDSVCEMHRVSCAEKKKINLSHTGRCGSTGPCSSHTCEYGGLCKERDGEAVCQCPVCSSEFDPVCGSDGISYSNECKLRLEACHHSRTITVLYSGLCNGCENKKCDYYSVCESDGTDNAKCVCPESCVEMHAPVCGTDGITYANECEMRVSACKSRVAITIAFKGDCASLTTPSLLENEHLVTPVAVHPSFTKGNGNINHIPDVSNSIAMSAEEEQACKDVRCYFDATCELGPDKFPRCSCKFNCSLAILSGDNKPVCASDMRLYSSVCMMKMEGCQRQEDLRLRPLDLCEGMEVKPCNGKQPLINPDTGKKYDCGSGLNRQDCPSGSYCHQTPQFAKCCKKETKGNLKSCEDSWYGCCPDGKTPALGSDNAGCPSLCGCNRLGSYSGTCDPVTGQCMCKPGVGGVKCDRCESGFWGLPKIAEGHDGCIACGCSSFGSVRDDCEQMTGRCMCKPGIQGQKCTVCTLRNKVLGAGGCVTAESVTVPPTSCSELTCFFGATCEKYNNMAKCVCRSTCTEEFDSMQAVCGNDGQTYGSECQLKLFSCKYQKEIVVQHLGACKELLGRTEDPLGRSTVRRFTEPEDVSSPLYKSTRHLLLQELGHRFYYGTGQDEINGLTSASFHPMGSERNFDRSRPTPATIGLHALVGDSCIVTDDCGVRFSHCINGACICNNNHMASRDRRECLEMHACASYPCQSASTCEDTQDGLFKCICPPLWTGKLCSQKLKPKAYDIPAFDSHSFIRLKRLKAYSKLSLEVEFMTYANDGIILYNQQNPDGTGDFISLAIVNGFVDFRYNLGNGPVIITSLERVELKKFHRVVVKRYHKDGILKLDDYEDVTGKSQGALKALDLVEDAYIGYVPTNISKVFENVGTTMGLIGCIRKFKIGRHTVELHEGYDIMVEDVVDVKECGENPCSILPCKNGGTCHAIDSEKYQCACTADFFGDHCESRLDPCLSNPCAFGSTCDDLPQGGFICKCPPGKKGKLCEQFDADLQDILITEFHGDSYLELPRLDGVGRAFSLEIWFMSRVLDGILLYNGQLTNGKGDFISLNLVNGYVQFKFDLGSGVANLTTADTIMLRHWHAVKVTRLNKDATLRLDNAEIVYGSSTPPLNELNLELPLYIGGVPSMAEVNQEADLKSGLTGAIQRLIINGHSWVNLAEHGDVRAHKGITIYDGDPCPKSENPCKNEGICQPILANYRCQCPQKFTGRHCEEYINVDDNDRPVKFDGGTFFSYYIGGSVNTSFATNNESNFVTDEGEDIYDKPDEIDMYNEYNGEEHEYMYDYEDNSEFFIKRRKGEQMNHFETSFKSTEDNGLLFWISSDQTFKSDYVAIAVVNGVTEFSFSIGKQLSFLLLKSKVFVSDGHWHTLVAYRQKRYGMLQVDEETPVTGTAESGNTLLNTDGQLWIGGAPKLSSGLPASYYVGFNGCLHHVKINKKLLNMTNMLNSDKSVIHFCGTNGA